MAAAPLAEIKEQDAAGDIAALYDDIRAVIGVPMVNLLFRHMATVPGCLHWAWATIRPLYISKAIPNAASTLTSAVMRGQAADLLQALETAHLSDANVFEIERVLDAYGRANPMNLIGLLVIDLALDQAPQAPGLSKIPALQMDDLRTPVGLADLLPMTDPTQTTEAVRDALNKLARQIHRSDTGVIPSLYRHFGAWPVFIDALHPVLAPVLDGEDFGAAVKAMETGGRDVASTLYWSLPLPDMPAPDQETTAALKKLIGQFPTNICRMTLLATLLGRGLN